MKTLITILLTFSALALFGQRQYTTTQIVAIDAASDANGGDLYHDTEAGILYIGLMTGKLVAIQNTDDQTLTYTNVDADDNVNTLQIEGHPQFNIDDNHLGTNDQILTGLRTINMDDNNLHFTSNEGLFRFFDTGSFYVEDASSPIIQTVDTRNTVQTKLQSANTLGIIGTTSAHSLQIRTNNAAVGQFETSGRLTLSNYGDTTFTGTVANLLAVQDNGVVIEVDPLSTDDQDLSDGGRSGVGNVDQTVDITNGNSVTFSIADNDNDSSNELQTISKTDDTVTLSNSGGTFQDDHLGTSDQTLDAQRDIFLDGNTLNIDSDLGFFSFADNGVYTVNDETTPIIQTVDATNGTTTRLFSSDNAGVVGTQSAHNFQFRTNNATVGQFETSGRFRLNNYGDTLFTGAVTNMLGVNTNGYVFEVDPASLNTDDQTLTYTNTDADDNINTLQIEGSAAFNIDDNHLGTNDQILTGTRYVDMSTFDMYLDGAAASNAQFRFVNGGSFYVSDDATPTIGTVDNTNGVSTRMYSGDTFGVVGTNTNHNLQLRSNSTVGLTLQTNGRVSLNEYGGGAFTGTLDNLLGINSAGVVIEVDPSSIGSDDQQIQTFNYNATNDVVTLTLEDGGGAQTINLSALDDSGTDDQQVQTFSYNATNDVVTLTLEDGGGAQTINLSALDDSGTDDQQIQTFSYNATNDVVTLTLEDGGGVQTINLSALDDSGTDDQTLTYTNTNANDNINTLQIEGSAVFNIDDNHLGTDNQTLTGARTINMSGNNLTFNGTQDVRIEADGDVGIGTVSPSARLDVDNGSVRFSDYGVGTYLDNLPAVDSAIYHLAVDAQGDVVETNTVKAAKVFYPPAVVIDVSSIANNQTIDLYQEYLDRMGNPGISSSSNGIPVYSRTELEYHVLDWDTSVFNIVAGDLSTGGVLTYDVTSVPTNNCTYINVVFVVK